MRRAVLGAFFIAAGTLHFVKTDAYAAIVPDALPRKREIVYASGVAEIAGGLGVLAARTSRGAAWWLIATLVAVFPANVNMAVNADRFRRVPEPLLWLRLPLQAGFVAWVWWGGVGGGPHCSGGGAGGVGGGGWGGGLGPPHHKVAARPRSAPARRRRAAPRRRARARRGSTRWSRRGSHRAPRSRRQPRTRTGSPR
jgi:uncharacterized membrane protein